MALTTDAGAFPALGGEHVGVAGVVVAPAQMGVQRAGEHHMVGVVGASEDEGAQRSEVRLDWIGPGGIRRGEVQLDGVPGRPGADLGPLCADRLSRIT